MAVFWIAFYVLFPVLAIYLCQKYRTMSRIGGVVLCYIAGLLLGNLKFITGGHVDIIPPGFKNTQDLFFILSVAFALSLIFFSLDIRRWTRVAGKALLSFFLGTIAVLISAASGYMIFKSMIGGETWKVSGMLIGCYTGGTPNLAAIGTALRIDKTVLASTQISDVAVGALYLLLMVTIMQRILLKFLPPFRANKSAGVCTDSGMDFEAGDYESFSGIFSREVILPLLGALGLAVFIVAVGLGLTFVFPEDYAMVVAVLAVCTLAILASFIPAVRRIPMTFQAGQYFILIFCVVVSSMSDLKKLFTTAPAMVGFVAWAVFVALVLHAALAAIFRIDADTVIIASVAGVMSPPFVPMVAAALKNKDIVVTGVVTGIIGWVIGTYLGIGMAYLLRSL